LGSSGISSSDQHSSGLKKSSDISSGQYSSNLGSSGISSGQHSTLGSSGISSGQHSSGLGASHISSDKDKHYSSGLASDKQFAGSTGHSSGVGYSSGTGYSTTSTTTAAPTIDRVNLGAEHKEVSYDKQPAIIPDKAVDKDKSHKVEVHGSLYTSGAGSTFKTNEAK
jgi:hypothetical protein